MNVDSKGHNAILTIGIIFIAAGIIFNEWTFGMLISHDGVITSLTARIIIWAFNGIFIFTGFLIIKYRSSIKVSTQDIMFVALAFVLFLIVFEGGLRFFFYIKGRNMNFSEYLGWQSKEHSFWKERFEGYGEIVFSTSKYGFRVFGDPTTNKMKIFVLGDSFTEGRTVSDGFAYYDYLKKHHDNIEIFAYGAGGYGSLQEYMILNKYFDMIKPDLILWQFCPNDLINNSQKLESLSKYNNNHNTRPYYDYKTGRISMQYPKKYIGWADKIIQHFYLLKLLSLRLDILNGEVGGSIEEYLKENDPLAIETIQTTSAIMGLVRKKAGNTPIVAFQTDNEQIKWSGDAFLNISRKHSIYYIDNVPETLLEAKAKGINIYGPNSSHWGEAGNSIVGKTILSYLIKNNLLTR